MEGVICPVCRQPLEREEKTWRCIRGHSYDIASQGYVNLLLSSRKHAKIPGDSREMVAARERFLASGCYGFLGEQVAKEAAVLLRGVSRPWVVDAGCGEGWYTIQTAQALREQGADPTVVGLDISKFALRSAARKDPREIWAVASIFDMPVADSQAHLILNLFAPIAGREFRRVLRPGGYLLVVSPGPDHLLSLKECLYDRAYRNGPVPEPEAEAGLILEKRVTIAREFTVPDRQLLQDLFQMTPYVWKSPRESRERLEAMESLTTQGDFVLSVYRKP